MLDDYTFKTVIDSAPLVSIDILLKKDNEDFKQISNVIVANRMVDELNDVKGKVYTRDLFKEG